MSRVPILLAVSLSAGAAVAAPAPLELARLPDDAALAALLWERSPEAVEARAAVIAAEAEQERAGLLQNPALGLTVGTIPIGQRNPTDVPLDPVTQIMNYGVSYAQTFELGKRGPRTEAATAALSATRFEAAETLREQWFSLVEAIQSVASAERLAASTTALLDDAVALRKVAEERARVGDVAGLEAERAALEEERLRATLAEAEESLAVALAECGRLASTTCVPFGSGAAASAYLERSLEDPADPTTPATRALEARAAAARAEGALAAATTLPDPTVSVGYVRDQFLISGNQLNSFNVGVSVPLAVFDRGQAGVRVASATAEAADLRREALVQRNVREATALRSRLAALTKRRDRLQNEAIPRASRLVQRLEDARARGGGQLTELLLARQALGALSLDAVRVDADRATTRLSLARASGFVPTLPSALLSRTSP